MSYDFSQLNDKEFESLCADLIGAHLGTRIERFKAGKDKGVDGRYYADQETEVIIQAKHYIQSGFSSLLGKLKREELPRLELLKPSSYLLITSLPLSRDNKKIINDTLSPFIKSPSDIYGQEDLNDILSKNPDIEEKHYKLWLTSTNVLKKILNNAITGRSNYELERIANRSYMYVPTDNHDRSIKILKKNKVIIITGEPGIGKTTLAENISLYYASKGYQFVCIEENLSEAESLFETDKKQLFYFDDFLGSNYLEAIENKKDSHIIRFIHRVKNSKKKLFILTSRTNILSSGIAYSSIFSANKINKSEFLLSISNLSEFEKAQILYNHLWFGDLEEEFIEAIYEKKGYKEIIKHKNFNPRVIEFITDTDRLISIAPREYWEYIEETLNNPKDVWDDCFKRQNNAYVRNLVLLTVFNNHHISETHLKRAFYELNQLEALKNNSHSEKDFNSMSQLAVKTFLNRTITAGGINFELFNPSIADYILSEYIDDASMTVNISRSLESVASIKFLQNLMSTGKISESNVEGIKDALIRYVIDNEVDTDYKLHVLSYCISDTQKYKKEILKYLRQLAHNPIYAKAFISLLSLFDMFFDELKIEDWSFLIKFIEGKGLLEEEISTLGNFLADYEINNSRLHSLLTEECTAFLEADLDQAKKELDFTSLITFSSYYNGTYYESDYEYDEGKIRDELFASVEAALSNFNSDYISCLEININELVDQISIQELVEDFVNNREYEPDYDENRAFASKTNVDTIDDLFDRG